VETIAAERKVHSTRGELFPDGSALEILKESLLVSYDQGREQIGRTVKHQGVSYSAARLDDSWAQALRFPKNTADYGSTGELVRALQDTVAPVVGFADRAALLLATAILGTWVAEVLPDSLIINPWGPAAPEIALLDVVGSLCRRGLRLAEPSFRDFASLPANLEPSIILSRPSPSLLRRIAAANKPNTFFLSKTEPVQLAHAFVVCTDYPVVMPAVTIPLHGATGSFSRLPKSRLQALADYFQPRLLRYRLSQHLAISSSKFAAPDGLSPRAQTVAQILGAVIEGSEELQKNVVHAVRSMDEQNRVEQSLSPAALVLEALLGLCHLQRPAAGVAEIAGAANALLYLRDENVEMSPKEVGGILRRDLGLTPRRIGAGWKLALDRGTQLRVHRLAAAHYLFPLPQPSVQCPMCRELEVSAGDSEPQGSASENHVH
jgi:hypothetical protein